MLSMPCYYSERFFFWSLFCSNFKVIEKQNGSTAGVSGIASLQNQTSYKKLEEEMQPEQVTVSSYMWWKIFQQWNDIKEKL